MARLVSRIGGGGRGSGVSGSASRDMQNVVANFNRYIADIRAAGPEALLAMMEPVKAAADEMCPVKTGAMKDSGFLEIVGSGRDSTVAFGYGRNGYPDYTAVVHESVEIPHAPPTQAKWAETALKNSVGLMAAGFIAGMRKSGVGR